MYAGSYYLRLLPAPRDERQDLRRDRRDVRCQDPNVEVEEVRDIYDGEDSQEDRDLDLRGRIIDREHGVSVLCMMKRRGYPVNRMNNAFIPIRQSSR